MSDHLYPIILAGGAGTRLWPRSRRHRPKQLLDLLTPNSMLQDTYGRVRPLLRPEQVFVITNADYVGEVLQQLPEVPPENIIGEPVGRGTAAPIALAALLLRERDPEAVMLCLPADHCIQRDEEFREAVLAAEELARKNFLVTFGVPPRYPETGYGYIEAANDLEMVRGMRACRVRRFTEKPDQATAAEFIAGGNYFWNSGIFIWRASIILEEFSRYLPEQLRALELIANAWQNANAAQVFESTWRELKNETIDVGIMEKSDRVAVLPLDVGWSDVGNWATLLDLLADGTGRNVVQGEHLGMETRGSLIYSEDRLIATVGLSDMIVVDTGDVVLVCPKSQAQRVKQIVDELTRLRQDKYL